MSPILADAADRLAVAFAAAAEDADRLRVEEVGVLEFVGQGVATARGLAGVRSEELVRFTGDLLGLAFDLDRDRVGIVLLDEAEGIAAGDTVRRTGRVLDVPVGDGLRGRVVDPLGRPRDGRGPVKAPARLAMERDAPGVMDRAPVNRPLQTGLKVVDAVVPIGRGQRELIVGDRQTGKTAIAVDTILNQAGEGVFCIYCAIGQRSSALAKVVAELEERDAMAYTTVVATTEDDPPGLRWAAAYAAMSLAEHARDRGDDALVVFDDLSRHARAYREVSLLLRRPPGREAFPGDIFYIHSRLLERSTQLREELGGGSITALPVVETEAQNISAYIPTNLISITDGQIYLSPGLFQRGVMPAVDVGRSVSRVGGDAQLPAYQAVAGDLRLAYSRFEELESFARFGTRLDEKTRATLARGRRVREALKQTEHDTMPVLEQIAILLAVTEGLLDELPVDAVSRAERAIREAVQEEASDLEREVSDGEDLDEDRRQRLLELVRDAVERVAEDVGEPSGGDRGG
ncbi:MAG TPA: alternate F1F0 ATPase, F1 subunit alpha [Candidatus Sulfomarinibacteraceae bacterium]|nr:alternate F1F0 ATPase, F1 subunit alpha [Candidatus Sulfomarinibacteraceae bacterium]